MKQITGIGASSGVAIAEVFKIEEVKIEAKSAKVANPQSELTRYNNAISKTIEQIQKIQKLSAKNLSEEEIEIFNAHILVAQDPTIQEEIKAIILEQEENAVFAVKTIADKYIEMFSSMDDEYMQERSSDIKDVTTKIIKNLLGISTINLASINKPTIIVAEDLTPSETAQLNKKFVKGFLTNIGGRTSHSAIMARSLEIPAILGLGNITQLVQNGDIVAMNGDKALVVINPDEKERINFENEYQQYCENKQALTKFLNKKSQTKDGKEVLIAANIGSTKDVEAVVKNGADAVGLFRSEFLYMDANDWPSEEEQFNAYKTVLEKMQDKSVVVRTLDIGGDKTLKYFKFPEEMNPFLGYRAIRMSLDKKETFITQLRALIRASAFGKLAIMFPMITTVQEFLEAKTIYQQVKTDLIAQGHKVSDDIQVGMMVEVPAAAIITEQFCQHADFVSIGTNDLMQYTMAADRMNEKVSYLYQPLNPSILNLINMTIQGAHKAGKWVGMCGEMGGDAEAIPLLVGMGLDEFSMSATAILAARKQISEINSVDAKKLVDKALKASTSKEVIKLVEEFNKNQKI